MIRRILDGHFNDLLGPEALSISVPPVHRCDGILPQVLHDFQKAMDFDRSTMPRLQADVG